MANTLTVIRVALIPCVVYALLAPVPGGKWTAAALFGIAALTDLFDGMLARGTGTVSDFGKVADPLADRVFVLCVLAALVWRGDVPIWAAAIVIGRDLLMVAGYRLMQAKGVRPEVSSMGKLSTAVLMISMALLVLEVPGALLAFYGGMIMSVASGIGYVLAFRGGAGGGPPRQAET